MEYEDEYRRFQESLVDQGQKRYAVARLGQCATLQVDSGPIVELARPTTILIQTKSKYRLSSEVANLRYVLAAWTEADCRRA